MLNAPSVLFALILQSMHIIHRNTVSIYRKLYKEASGFISIVSSQMSLSLSHSLSLSLKKKKERKKKKKTLQFIYFSKHLPEWRWKYREDGRRVAMAWFLGANVNHPASGIADRNGLGVEAVILRDGVGEETPRRAQ